MVNKNRIIKCVAAVALLAVVVSIFSGCIFKPKSDYVLYVKDGEIFINNLKKDDGSWQVSNRLFDSGELEDSSYTLSYYTILSKNGKLVFFPDKIDESEKGFNLYYKKLNSPDEDAVKIDSGVTQYVVSDDASVVTYKKDEENKLYQYQIKKDTKDKIDDEVSYFYASDDGKTVVYINEENSIYVKKSGKDREKLVSEASGIRYISDDFTTIYYVRQDALYKHVIGAEKQKLLPDVDNIIAIYDSGEIYYTTKKDMQLTLADCVTDDLAETDAAMTLPERPTYPDYPSRPWRSDYDTTEEYEAAYEEYEAAYDAYLEETKRLNLEYQEAYAKYNEKLDRDSLRESLRSETIEYSQYTLNYYDGKKSTVLSDNYDIYTYYYTEYYYRRSYENAVITYLTYGEKDFENVKFSEITSVYTLKDMVTAARTANKEAFVAVKGNATAIEMETPNYAFTTNTDGTLIYYFDEVDEETSCGTLYRISIENGTVGKPVVYDTEVFTGSCRFTNDTNLIYFKNLKDGNGDLYIDKKAIDYDVRSYGIYTDEKRTVYMTDWSEENSCGTLKVYEGEKTVKAADDVYSFTVTESGRILYLYDYSAKYHNGELREWAKGKSTKIDDDVFMII